jgi:exopolyphosphatase / guanosine-5'-triphosphate,3'-diphosphate pyrophosphatase
VKTAVIDIGSNTLLLLVVDARGAAVVDECRFGRLGKGLDATGRLADASIAASLDICREYRAILDAHGVAQPIVIATQAVREAANGSDFARAAERILGAPIEIIAGEREAELALAAVRHTFPELAQVVVVDVGGASTEIIASDRGRLVSAVSVPIGAVRMTERHLHHDPPTADEIRALAADLDAQLAPLALPQRVPVVATAGTATTIAALVLELPAYDADAVTGVHVTRAVVEAQLGRLCAATIAERRVMRGMEPQRADVIAGGVAILARVMARLDATEIITCDRGIRWGRAYEAMSTAHTA